VARRPVAGGSAVVIDGRIAERRAEVRDERRRRRLRRTLLVLLAVGVIAALAAVERSALVGLEEVQVTGVQRLDADEVRDAADLALGTSTLRLGLSDAADRVTAIPLVHSAQARRLDPLTVEIAVEERRPALVAVGGGEYRLVDRDGVVILDGGRDELTPIHLDHPPPPPGGVVADDPALANAHAVWRGLSGPLRARVQRFDAEGTDDLWLELDTGVQVRFGRAERIDEKVRALGAVLGDVGETPVEVIDVRAPSTPVVTGP
jgi:cell division protein FtsQ